MTDQPLQLWQLPSAWGLPNPSPFCMKLEAWLRLNGLVYEPRTLGGPPRSKTGKAPYVIFPDGRLLSDTSHIVTTLSAERGLTLDAALSPTQSAELILVQRLFEEHLYWIAIFDRWLDPKGWELTRRAYFAGLPLPLRWIVPPILRRFVRRDAHGQGLSRLPRSELLARASADFGALARVLGDQSYFLGPKSTADAIALAFLANVYFVPIAGVLQEAIQPFTNLEHYTRRLFREVFPDYHPPRADAAALGGG